ncbi:uncharacterized protein LOC118648507 [Monomorium pharaonis]|uniref:uncharacterized protein LOC118648507 n=1 Tax=Monomorium pharaonis TaxID=307658 RepID=UPI001745DE6B|nr:uncharacterized protein LOC118648507 [Monomorium pharaonis]
MLLNFEFCHTDICDLIIKMNNTHGFYLLFCSANCFFTLTAALYETFLHIKNETDINYMYIWGLCVELIMYTMQFGSICWFCELARQEFNKTKIIMCAIALKCQSMKFDKLNDTRNQSSLEVRPPLESADGEQNFNWSNSYVVMENLLRKYMAQDHVNNEINGFLIHLQHRQVSFTACNFFEMNNNLFCSFVQLIFTYLGFFTQFHS